MIPSSAIQVVEHTPSRLAILDPPYYLIGWCFLVVGVSVAIFVLLRGGRSGWIENSRWTSSLLGVPFLLIGFGFLTSKTTAVFSRESQMMTINSSRFGISHKVEVPLSSIRSANVVTGSNTRRLIVVLDSGTTINLTGLTDKQGQYPAMNAINDFLGQKILH
jgi:hypothetical protein